MVNWDDQGRVWSIRGPVGNADPIILARSTSDAGPLSMSINSIDLCQDEVTGAEQTKITFNVDLPLATAAALFAQQGGVPTTVYSQLPSVLNLEMTGSEFRVQIPPSSIALLVGFQEENQHTSGAQRAINHPAPQMLPSQAAQQASTSEAEAMSDEKIFQPKMTDVVFGRYV